MEHRRKRWGFALTEIFMSLLIVISAVILVLDWKHYEYFFIIAFAAAALLFLARGIRTIGEDKSHLAGGILYLIGATFMVSFLTASILTILGGSLRNRNYWSFCKAQKVFYPVRSFQIT